MSSLETDPLPLDGRARRRHRNAELLYEAADALLAEHSFDEVSVDDICARAGVGRATFFRIYDTKAGLLREFNRRLTDDAAARIAGVPASDIRTVLDQIRQAIIDAWRHAGPGHFGMARAFVSSVPTGDVHGAHPELLELVTEHITAAIDAGELTAAVPADLAAALALVQLTAPIAYVLSGRATDLDELSTVLLDQWLSGMRPGTPPPSQAIT